MRYPIIFIPSNTRTRTLAIPFLFVFSFFKYWNKLKFELYTLKIIYDYRVRIIQFAMCAKITSLDICAAFSLRRAAFLRKCCKNRCDREIEKRISELDSASQNWLRPSVVVQLAKILLFSVTVINQWILILVYVKVSIHLYSISSLYDSIPL